MIFLYLAWFQALIATAGSLYFSEVLKYPPCVLCWYQRIAVYPLVIFLAVGIARKSRDIAFYVLPLTLLGWLISLYHNLLYYKVLPESAAPCLAGVSCTTRFIEYFGFITIPLLSFLALTFINICLFLYARQIKKYDSGN
jgi:disulfide bond formation protein DsbB